jgi:hypothetical protein
MWHDTVVIKTQANVGDSWLFFRDSADIYYRAYVVSKSTRSIYGTVDSVKVLQLKAFHRDTGYIPSNPINNLKITLSKNYGFYEVFDFSLFPRRFVDPHLPMISNTITDYFYRWCGPQQFRHIQVNIERGSDLYNYEVGDIIERMTYCAPLEDRDRFMLDSITSKTTVTGFGTDYTTYHRYISYCNPYGPPTVMYGTSNAYGGPELLNYIDTSLMPEEYGIQTMYFYNQVDTSYCFTSPRYWWKKGALFNEFEPCESGASYKMGLGQTYSYTCGHFGPIERHTYGGSMTFARKNGIYCGHPHSDPNNIPTICNVSPTITMAPNPANNELSITAPTTGKHTISLTDMFGRQVLAMESEKELNTINTSQFPTGLYIINVRDKEGNVFVQKVSILH